MAPVCLRNLCDYRWSDAVNLPDSYKRQVGPGGLESRALPADAAPITVSDDTSAPVIRGYMSVNDIFTTIGGDEYGFDEMFVQGCWTVSLETADVRCTFNHDGDQLLGRTKPGTLRLAEDAVGLAYEVDVNQGDPQAISIHAKVKRGDVDGSSVWFRVVSDEWVYPDETNDLVRPQRKITEAALIEGGPVTWPAYEDAECCARSMKPMDTVLRAAGVKSDHKRAQIANALVSDPESVEDQIRSLFAAAPDLRSAVCACELPKSGPDTEAAPADTRGAEPDSESAPSTSDALALAMAHLELRRTVPA